MFGSKAECGMTCTVKTFRCGQQSKLNIQWIWVDLHMTCSETPCSSQALCIKHSMRHLVLQCGAGLVEPNRAPKNWLNEYRAAVLLGIPRILQEQHLSDQLKPASTRTSLSLMLLGHGIVFTWGPFRGHHSHGGFMFTAHFVEGIHSHICGRDASPCRPARSSSVKSSALAAHLPTAASRGTLGPDPEECATASYNSHGSWHN